MESELLETKAPAKITLTKSSSSSNQLYISDTLDLPEDTFRMSLDNFSVIGENVTISEREYSIDTELVIKTPELETPPVQPPDANAQTPKSPPIDETPKVVEKPKPKLPPLQLALIKNDDVFVKPSPVSELMSPARTLQFEVNTGATATPTMKRAAIDFDFFAKNNFDEYFQDIDKAKVLEENKEEEIKDELKETAVIVKSNTVRHEIGYGTYDVLYSNYIFSAARSNRYFYLVKLGKKWDPCSNKLLD